MNDTRSNDDEDWTDHRTDHQRYCDMCMDAEDHHETDDNDEEEEGGS